MEWTTSCPDWADRLQSGLPIIPDPIYPERAAEALALFKRLRIVDAPGSPTFGEACQEWVFRLVAVIFGSYNVETGRRLLRQVLVLIPKKNSKSTLAAGIMVTALQLNWRQSAELLILAPTVKIAQNAFDPARDMIYADPQLNRVMHITEGHRIIKHRLTKATLRVLAADSDTVGGSKASWVLIDELWLFGKKANASSMFREAFGGLMSRPEGVVIKLSTQSDDVPQGVFKEDLDIFRDVRDGKVIDNTKLPVLYEHPPEMVEDGRALLAENLHLVNPNLGKSVDEETLVSGLRDAERLGPAKIREYMAKHGNVELGLNQRNDRWPGADFWLQQADPSLTLDEILRRSDVVTVGIDGGGLDDLLGLAIIGRCKTTRHWLVWCRAWAHRIVFSRRKDIETALLGFEARDELVIVERPGEDVREVADIICHIDAIGLLPAQNAIGVDPAGINAIVDELTGPGRDIDIERIRAVSQGWKMSGAIKTTERALAGQTMQHGGQTLMAWCVGNAKAVQQFNSTSITKQHSGTAKIDPLMALFNAASLMGLNPESQGSIGGWLSGVVKTR